MAISLDEAARQLGPQANRVFIHLRERFAENDADWTRIDFVDLARTLGITRDEATRAVQRLVKHGLLSRSDCIGGPRAYAVNLSFGHDQPVKNGLWRAW